MNILETKNITLLTETEETEAEEIKKKKRHKYLWLYLTPILCFIIALIICLSIMFSPNSDIDTVNIIIALIVIIIVFIIALITGIIIYCKKMKPYKKLVKIAQKNDLIRHEEKVRVAERERLKTQTDLYITSDIQNTIDKTKKQGQ